MAVESKYTKWKITIGYILIVSLSLLAAGLIYKQVMHLIHYESNFGIANQKIFIVGNTISNLYEAETLSSAFVQTGKQSYFKQFLTTQQQIQKNIDTLKLLSRKQTQILRLDSIKILLREKIKNLQELVWVKESFSPEEFYNKAIATITNQDSLQETPHIRKRLITRLDTTYIETKKVVKRWIFSKIVPDTTMQVSISYEMVQDTLHELDDTRNTDTVIHILRNTWQDVQRHSEEIIQKIHQQEYALIQQSTKITNQLKRILSTYEQEELLHTIQKQQTREKTIATTIQVLSWIAGISFILILFFIIFIFRDLTKSQRYRQKLEEANAYTDQLLKSREKMILTVTHDIKSPLSSILGYIELLNTTPVNERQHYFLKNMQNSSEHILQLVNNLLDLSKLENNKITIEEVIFNPKQLFQEISDTFLPLANKKQLILKTKLDEGLNCSIAGDALRIRQIITNILSNAIKYTSEGEVVFSAFILEKQKQLILQIRDCGSGMTSEEQQFIFEEFSRLKCHHNIEGTGLGLTITLKLIQLLGGELQVESQPGQGSCFIISLPFTESEETKHEENASKIVEVTLENKKSSPHLKVLLVDDDPLQLSMTQGLLEKEGIEVQLTTHPQEVLHLLQIHTYDLIFSDIQMPEMDGFELIQKIRALPQAKQLSIIALSANATYEEVDYIKQGFSAYLNKPFTSDALFKIIHQLTGYFFQPKTSNLPKVSEESTEHLYTLKNIQLFTDNQQETLQTILQTFIESTQEHLRLFDKYLAEKEYESISRLAHKMLPMFRQLEAQSCIDSLEKLERKDQLELPKESIASLTQEAIEKIKQLLELIL